MWLGLVYIVALVLLLITAFWSVDSFTGEINQTWTLDNIVTVVTGSLYQTVTLRTVGVALAVTIIDIAIALPVAFFMAKVASARLQRILVIAVLTPLWASYLVKAYAWRSVLSQDGIWEWIVAPFGGQTPGYGLPATIITLSYLWLPYVILPIYAGLDRVPDSLLEASGDLGGKTWSTLRLVVLPIIWPAIIAGSIFSFSLSLGDYITVNIVGGANQMLGNLVYTNVGAANNLPLAAAIALIPIVIIFGYLALVRRTGALDNL
ncbi:MAG: ABC transporter permease [Leifsonia sp.]